MSAIHKGAPLSDQGAYEICRSRPTTIVALVGPVRCGKTTLIAGFHQSFLAGPVGNYSFRKSVTLVGFEEKCFNSRVASGGERAIMPRTSNRVGREYYHLGITEGTTEVERDLLLLDMSGEYYERAVSTKADAEQLHILKRVDRVALILDGERLYSPRFREKVFTDASMLLRRCDEEGLLLQNTPLQIVVSKLDRVVPTADETQIAAQLEKVRRRFQASVERSETSVMGVAANPLPATPYPMRYGMPALLQSWLEPRRTIVPPTRRIQVASKRIAGRLATAWLPENYL